VHAWLVKVVLEVVTIANTIYITDTVLGTEAGLTVTDGVLLINGANQLQVGQLKFVNNKLHRHQKQL
jgi:hypothetical protein